MSDFIIERSPGFNFKGHDHHAVIEKVSDDRFRVSEYEYPIDNAIGECTSRTGANTLSEAFKLYSDAVAALSECRAAEMRLNPVQETYTVGLRRTEESYYIKRFVATSMQEAQKIALEAAYSGDFEHYFDGKGYDGSEYSVVSGIEGGERNE